MSESFTSAFQAPKALFELFRKGGTQVLSSHRRPSRAFFPLCALLLFAFLSANPLPLAAATIPESEYQSLRWRLVGPFRGGWATVVAGVPGDATTFYFGAADGGVWKSDDAGATWRSVFSDLGSASIGALAVAPSDPKTIWAGTGQIQQRWDITSGDGVYRSTDAGESWTHA